MIRDLGVEAWGRPCIRNVGTGGMVPTGGMARITDDRAFLAEPLWADPCADAIWTESALDEDPFNPTDRGYRDVHLDRRQFLAAITAPREPVSPARSNQAEHPAKKALLDAVKYGDAGKGKVSAAKPVPDSKLRHWLRSNGNAQLSERKGWPAAKTELGGHISRSRFRRALFEARKELGLEIPPGRPPRH